MSWTPAAITTKIWLDAADSSTITIDTGISVWGDKSGNSNDALQADTDRQPVVTSGGLNSLDVITFDGTNDWFSLTSNFLVTTDMTVVMVLQRPSTGILTVGISGGTYSYPFGFMWFSDNVKYTALGDYLTTHGSADTSTGTFISTARRTSSVIQLRENGTQIGSDTSPETIGTDLFRGVGNRAAVYHTGYIAEIVVCETSTEYELIEGYLAWKWGLEASLPVGHPYKSSAPLLLVESSMTGGAVVGGSAPSSINYYAEYLMVGGAIVGSAAIINSSLEYIMTGGAVVGGSAAISRSFEDTMSGGAIVGGSAEILQIHKTISFSGSIGFVGDIEALQWLNDIEGSIGFAGSIGIDRESYLAIAGSLGFAGTIDATVPQSFSLIGNLGVSGLMNASQSEILSMDGVIGFEGGIDIVNQNLISIDGSIGFGSDISILIAGSNDYSLLLHNSTRWT